MIHSRDKDNVSQLSLHRLHLHLLHAVTLSFNLYNINDDLHYILYFSTNLVQLYKLTIHGVLKKN